jgi:hypothetical protein
MEMFGELPNNPTLFGKNDRLIHHFTVRGVQALGPVHRNGQILFVPSILAFPVLLVEA